MRNYNMLYSHLCDNTDYVKHVNNMQGYTTIGVTDNILGNLIENAKLAEATEIRLPYSYMDSCEKTLLNASKNIYLIRKELPDIDIMGVPTGRNLNEWLECYVQLAKLDIKTIGITKEVDKLTMNGRKALLTMLYDEGLIFKILDYHLIEVIDTVGDIKANAEDNPWIRSIDTSSVYSICERFPYIPINNKTKVQNVKIDFNATPNIDINNALNKGINRIDGWVL